MCNNVCIEVNETVENISIEVRDFSVLNIISQDVGNSATTGTDGLLYVPSGGGGGVSKHSELILDDGTNPHGTTKTDVGLGNVDNTSDADKPISNAVQLALDDKQDTLVSGGNIRPINGESILGSTNLVIGGGKETYIFEYASQTLPTSTNWQVSNYNSSQFDNLFRNNTATTYPTLNPDVGGHYVRKTGNVIKIIFKMLRRNPAIAINFDVYIAKFVKVDGDIGFGTETIIANQNIVSSALSTSEAIIKTLTLTSTAITEGEHLYIALRNNTGVAVTLYDPQIIIITE